MEKEIIVKSFMAKQKLPYEAKKNYAYKRAYEFLNECEKRNLNCHVSVGGLDSITLFIFLKSIGINIPAISVSHLEDKSIQEIHTKLGIEKIKPLKNKDGKYWNKSNIIKKFGYPILSKEIAHKIESLQNPTIRNETVRKAIMTGETGKRGGYKNSKRMILSKRWLKLFGGYEDNNYKIPDFKVSAKCCYYLKEKPCDNWAKKNNSVPFLGMMASEGGRRQRSLMLNGCNYFGKTKIRSCPFAIFNRDDLLKLAIELNVPVPKIYGNIKKDYTGKYYTTGALRTGCVMCGFGIHLEKRPHRFDKLKLRNLKEWEYWMYEMEWGKVLDYINVKWEENTSIMKNQINMFDKGVMK